MSIIQEKLICYHCGDECDDMSIHIDSKYFCCVGCKNVFEILANHHLSDYYEHELHPGIQQNKNHGKTAFDYLDEEKVKNNLLSYKDSEIEKVSLYIPAIHCSSCIWLLEQLYQLDKGVTQSNVNFLNKKINLTYKREVTSLKNVVSLLSSLGYEPNINLNSMEQRVHTSVNRKLWYQIGVAGFCFGNIMLISFPEYFGLGHADHQSFSVFFGYLNLFLSLPVFFFSAQDYFFAAYRGLRNKMIVLDLPLALGILVLFVRSAYEVISHTNIGYFDTHAGLVFFLLIGKWFQQTTFSALSFDRDYKSYFPVACSVVTKGEEKAVPITDLNVGNRIRIRHGELIPADSILLQGDAKIDYSFVTGESRPVSKILGEIIHAGGKQTSGTLELEVIKPVNKSYLTELWNNQLFSKQIPSAFKTFQTKISVYFTYILLSIAAISSCYWLIYNPSLSIHALTSVLIIACPCALALSSPFALGTAMRVLGRKKFYVKSTESIERISYINQIVFDKTGTITISGHAEAKYHGDILSESEKQIIASLASQSLHPLSKRICKHLKKELLLTVNNYSENSGKGISGNINGINVMLGSYYFVTGNTSTQKNNTTRVYLKINDCTKGYFEFTHQYRSHLQQILIVLGKAYHLHLLSGDNSDEKQYLDNIFPENSPLLFNQSPADKLKYIEKLNANGGKNKTLMMGDGLNDAGALKAASVGVSITEDTSLFTPASDVIMHASSFHVLPQILTFCKRTRLIIYCSFGISLLYNIVGLFFAVQGLLSPVFAAVLMPLSSFTVIAFNTISVEIQGKILFKK